MTDANPLEMRFSTDAGWTWSTWEAYAAAKSLLLPDGDGARTVYSQYRDTAGNARPLQDDIILDTIAPATADNHDGLRHRGFTLVLTPTDTTSGVASTLYRIDGGAWKSGTSVLLVRAIRHKRSGLAAGADLVEYYSTDNAGNVEAIESCTVTA